MIFKEKKFVYPNYSILEDGTWIKHVGDGTAHDENGNQYQQVFKELPDDEYQFIGWEKI